MRARNTQSTVLCACRCVRTYGEWVWWTYERACLAYVLGDCAHFVFGNNNIQKHLTFKGICSARARQHTHIHEYIVHTPYAYGEFRAPFNLCKNIKKIISSCEWMHCAMCIFAIRSNVCLRALVFVCVMCMCLLSLHTRSLWKNKCLKATVDWTAKFRFAENSIQNWIYAS